MINVVKLTPIRSEFNRSIELTKDSIKSLGLGIILHFQYRNDNMVNLNVFVRYAKEGSENMEREVVVDTGFSFFAEWNDFQAINPNEDVIKGNMEFRGFVAYAWAFVGGYIFKQTEGTVLNTAFVPNPDLDKLVESIHFEMVQE